MVRTVHLATAAHIAQCDVRWLDNLLSRHDVPGVERARRGVTRQIAPIGILVVFIVHEIVKALGASLERALPLAVELATEKSHRSVLTPEISLAIDVTKLRRIIESRTRDAAESLVLPRRGRPPGGSRRSVR